MRNTSSNRGARNRSPVYVAILFALGTSAASAVDLTGVVVHPDGSMTFPNVRVVNAPHLATTAAPMRAQPGLRAYVDSETGMLRGPTQEELNQQAAEDQMLQQLNLQRGGYETRVETFLANGAVMMQLDDSSLVYSVVRKADNGQLDLACVTGSEQASKLLYLKAPSLHALRRESRNDH